MKHTQAGFTLIELMIVVVIIGVLAAIAIPNFITMQDRAKEGSTKTNMHTFQLAAEDVSVQNDGAYGTLATVKAALPGGGVNFKNPFDRTLATALGAGTYATMNVTPPVLTTATPGMVEYGPNGTAAYVIGARGKSQPVPLLLTSGQ